MKGEKMQISNINNSNFKGSFKINKAQLKLNEIEKEIQLEQNEIEAQIKMKQGMLDSHKAGLKDDIDKAFKS